MRHVLDAVDDPELLALQRQEELGLLKQPLRWNSRLPDIVQLFPLMKLALSRFLPPRPLWIPGGLME